MGTLYFAELVGLFLVGYGIWFTSEGVRRYWGTGKDWWRPLGRKRRYPYPVSGILLGFCFVVMGLVFVLNNVWAHARSLAYAGGALFILVVVFGLIQPRVLHPRWYGALEDRLGKKTLSRLRSAAIQMEDQEWVEVIATEDAFNAWVERMTPGLRRAPQRGYQKRDNGK